MSFTAATLARLLPALHLLRDAERAAAMGGLLTAAESAELNTLAALASPTPEQQDRLAELRERQSRGPLQALLSAFANQLAVLEENLEQLHDDQFIETCAEWVIPYIGDLIGCEPLHNLGATRALARAEVARTIALRRRKGTAATLEQLAVDVTGWKARAVEYFELLGATQYLNHPRPHCRQSPDLRRWEPLERIGGAFDSLSHTVDVRRIVSGRGRFNIPNVGLWLWRLEAHRHSRSPAVRVDDRRYLVSPLGHPLQLFTHPRAEEEISHLAEPANVPEPISRRWLDAHLAQIYGTRPSPEEPVDLIDPSLVLYVNGSEVPRKQIKVCNLANNGLDANNQPLWAPHELPDGTYGIDPELGRITVASDLPPPETLEVTYHHGFSANLGGGEYPRALPVDDESTTVLKVPDDHRTIQAALDALGGAGVVEITDSGRYEEALSVHVAAGSQITLRAAPGCRPMLNLQGYLMMTGGVDSSLLLDGLLIAAMPLKVPKTLAGGGENLLAQLVCSHLTLVPGRSLDASGEALCPGAPSLEVEGEGMEVRIVSSIVGSLRIAARSKLFATDSILDANDSGHSLYCAPDAASPGGELSLSACTLIGRVHAIRMELVTNSLFLARSETDERVPPVRVDHCQSGCVRFSLLPAQARVPRRYRCLPDAEGGVPPSPHFTTLRYGEPAYAQLAITTPEAIRLGADDEGEMGAFHGLYAAQRQANLEVRLREYLRAGLAAGICYQT